MPILLGRLSPGAWHPRMEASPEQRGGGLALVRRRPPEPPSVRERLKARLQRSCECSRQGAWGLVQGLLPATRWLRRYRPREDLAGDVMSGLVIGIILVPQAIAYSLLAGLQPVYSLYTSFFANLIYFLMGTSRHVSVGIFSLLCLMVGQVVDRELLLAGFDPAQDGPGPGDNRSTLNASATTLALGLQDCGRDCYAIRVATALTLMAGIYQVRSWTQRGSRRTSGWGPGRTGVQPQEEDRAGRGQRWAGDRAPDGAPRGPRDPSGQLQPGLESVARRGLSCRHAQLARVASLSRVGCLPSPASPPRPGPGAAPRRHPIGSESPGGAAPLTGQEKVPFPWQVRLCAAAAPSAETESPLPS